MISSETVLDDLNLKFTSKFNHGCLYCAILKAFYGFKEKIAHRARDNQFIFQNVQNEISEIFKIFKNDRAACWVNSKISNRDNNTTIIIFFDVTIVAHYYEV